MSIHKKGSALPRRIKVQSTLRVQIRIFFMLPQSLSVLSLKVVSFLLFFAKYWHLINQFCD